MLGGAEVLDGIKVLNVVLLAADICWCAHAVALALTIWNFCPARCG
jgi:hypothetical protein